MIGYFIVLILLVAFSAFFSAVEIAIFSTTPAKLKTMIDRNLPGARKLAFLKNNPKKTLATILVGNNIVNITASALATMLAIRVFGEVGTGLATGVMVLIVLVFGEVTPKSYAIHHADALALRAAPFLLFLMKLLYPVIILFEFLARKITKTEKGIKPPKVTEEELKAMLEISAASGGVEREEKEMMERVLAFSDVTVKEVMTRRSEMVCLDANLKLKDTAVIMQEHGFSRYPVNIKTKENIVGWVHIKDLFFAINQGHGDQLLKSIVSKAYFVPQHTTLSDLFKQLQEKQTHLAIVVNDYGEVIGLVTLEDLLEELVGEIIDESDVKQHMIKRLDKQTVLAHGTTELKALNRFFHTNLPGMPNDSLSKIILKNIKRFPKTGETLNINQNELTIVETTPKKIIKLKIKKLYE